MAISPPGPELSDLAFWAEDHTIRERTFAHLREHAPISHHRAPDNPILPPGPDDPGYWAVVRHEDIRRISRDPKRFCSGQGVLFGDAPPEMLEASQSFLATDAPRHTLLRGLVSAAFTPRQIARIEDGIRRDAVTVVDRAAEHGGGDAVELLAKPLPLMTISAMLGVPETDRERIVEAANALVSVADPDFVAGRVPLAVLGEALWTLTQAAQELAAHREARPADDLMTELVQARVDGARLTHAEIGAFFVLLAVAGNDTTRHTTAHGLRALTLHPEQRATFLADPATAVEELVRWATPVMTFRRTATEDVELHGRPIAAGEKVVLFYTSGNRDAAVFDKPGRFDLARSPNRHLGFGGGGPHYCLGASLARTQLRAIFTEMLTRLGDVECGEPAPLVGAFIHGVQRMDARWD